MLKEDFKKFNVAKKSLTSVVVLSFFLEIIFFPTLGNFIGGILAIFSWFVYGFFFLKRQIILKFPFAFIMYTSMFLYRFLPLIATLIEGKPITYGFENPIETFLYEFLLFTISSLAFYIACPKKKSNNNILTKILFSSNFFKAQNNILWILGMFGFIIRLYTFRQGDVEFGDISGKFLSGLNYLIYSPLLLFFPGLLNLKTKPSKRNLWFYLIVITIINIASNSRLSIITPIGIYIILFFLNLVKNDLDLSKIFSPIRISFILIIVFFGINFFSDISTAMLYTRKVRSDLDKEQLFIKTLDVYNDKELMKSLKKIVDNKVIESKTYVDGWDETYIDNFMLNRYANMRISDQSLYYAKKKGYGDNKMSLLFNNQVLSLVPTPILVLFDIDLNKSNFKYSSGDLLYGENLGTYRVSSHVGIGLATFGYLYFPFQFFISYLVFKLLNTFVLNVKNNIIYSPFALINVFTFLGMFRNSNGLIMDLGYILRGYIQGVFTFALAYWFASLLSSIVKK